jgi:hypothetical protein
MIIKSKSRSNRSFGGLYNYLTREDEFEMYGYNLYTDVRDKDKVIDEFMKNSEYITKSMGKNYLYHEILSLEESNLSPQKQREILLDLSEKYLELRAKDNLALQVLHTDKKHTHLHLMISANSIESHQRHRVSKKEFANIQKQIEAYKNSKYPELKSNLYQKTKEKIKETSKEQDMKHKRGKSSKKDHIYQTFKDKLKTALSKEALEKALKNEGFEIYSRGKATGIVHDGKKYRLKTLNLDKEYKTALREFEIKEARKERRSEYKEAQKNSSKEKAYKSHEKSKSNDTPKPKSKYQQRSEELNKIREQQAEQSKSHEKSYSKER